MKNRPTLHDRKNANNSVSAGNGAVRLHFRLGLDVDLRHIVAAIQCERSLIGSARKFSRAQLLAWVKKKIAQGHTVHAVYDCCGFGYTLHEELVRAGAHCIVTTPMRLNLERRRKNDRMDGRELCVRRSRYLDGHREELKPVRIPSRTEQQRRELGDNGNFGKKSCGGWKITAALCASNMSMRL